jgi:hypothetical protein
VTRAADGERRERASSDQIETAPRDHYLRGSRF